MTVTRLFGHWLIGRYGGRSLVRSRELISAVRLGVTLTPNQPGLLLLGFVSVGVGMAPLAPLVFGEVSRLPG